MPKACSLELSDAERAEVAAYVSALRVSYAARGEALLLFERYVGNSQFEHMHVQVVPLPPHIAGGAAAAFNYLIEDGIDARMKRTAWRATAKGELSRPQTLAFSAVLCAIGMVLLGLCVNVLTMWLTFATFIGYAVIYTVIL